MKYVRVMERYGDTKTALSQYMCVCGDGCHVIYDTRKGKKVCFNLLASCVEVIMREFI